MTDVADNLLSFNKHTHPPNPTERVVDRIKEKIKTRAKNEITPIPNGDWFKTVNRSCLVAELVYSFSPLREHQADRRSSYTLHGWDFPDMSTTFLPSFYHP